MDLEELKQKTLQLDSEARAYLARELLVSLDTMTEQEIHDLWLQEAMTRDRELDQDTSQGHSFSELLSHIRLFFPSIIKNTR